MRAITSFTLFFLFITVMLYSGCKDSITGGELDNKPIPASNVSYADNIQQVLNLKCASSGCHDDITRAGNYSLTTYTSTTNPEFLFKGHPESSKIVYAIDPQYANVQPMPPLGYAQLTQAQITGIEKWIEEGAKDN